jgi:hypothetical protein
MVIELRAQRKALEADLATAERERVETVPTGRKIGQVWAELEPAERRPWLKRRGISVHLAPGFIRIVTPIRAGRLSAIGRIAQTL